MFTIMNKLKSEARLKKHISLVFPTTAIWGKANSCRDGNSLDDLECKKRHISSI